MPPKIERDGPVSFPEPRHLLAEKPATCPDTVDEENRLTRALFLIVKLHAIADIHRIFLDIKPAAFFIHLKYPLFPLIERFRS